MVLTFIFTNAFLSEKDNIFSDAKSILWAEVYFFQI